MWALFSAPANIDRETITPFLRMEDEAEAFQTVGWISYVLKHKGQELADSQTFYSSLEGVEEDENPEYYTDDSWDIFSQPQPQDLPAAAADRTLYALNKLLEALCLDDEITFTLEEVQELLEEKETEDNAPPLIAPGTQVYRRGSTTLQKFSADWDATAYVPETLVDVGTASHRVTINTLPKSLHKQYGSCWGTHPALPEQEFFGKTRREVVLKAAIAVAHKAFHGK